jgi:Zn-dependent peptidase ImmA (M78 family)
MDNDGAFFYAFVLLHEIAHTLLNHDSQNSAEIYNRNELEADEWAHARLMETPEFFQ